ncbi:MAG: hypothetical protein QXP70_04910 [Methanomassiliicoccales archaeon]
MSTPLITIKCDNCRAEIELDQGTVELKKNLGKRIECPLCRNRRIAAARSELQDEIEETEGKKARNVQGVKSLF